MDPRRALGEDRGTPVTVIRTAACTVKGCPRPRDPDWHIPWCGHGLAGEHHHVTKRSQGGKDGPQVFLCHDCHNEVDNGSRLGNAVVQDADGNLCYVLGETKDKNWEHPLIWRVIEEAKDGHTAEDSRRGSPVGIVRGSGGPDSGDGADVEAGRDGAETLRARSLGQATVAEPALAPSPSASHGDVAVEANTAAGTSMVTSTAAAPLQDWCQRGMGLISKALIVERASTLLKFEIGDWVNEGEAAFGESAQQFLGVFSYWQVASWASVARRVPALSRDNELPFTYHREVAALPPPEQRERLAGAKRAGMSRRELHEALQGDVEERERHDCPGCGHNHVVKA